MAIKEVNFWNDPLLGGTGDDILVGDWRDNVIDGNDGADEIMGDGGNDTLVGDGGNDELFGQTGDDRVFGGRNDDLLMGNDGNDELFGGEDNDELRGGRGDDELFGEAGNDIIIDTEGVDLIEGGDGNDTIVVSGGDTYRFDRVSGGSGDDDITALKAKMLVSAGSGNDEITTDVRPDKVVGGNAGSDRFILTELISGTGRVAELFGGDVSVEQDSILFQGERILSTTPGADTSIDTLDLSQLQGMDSSAFAPLPDVGFVNRAKVDLSQGLLTSFSGQVGFETTPFTPTPGIEGAQDRHVARLFGIENVVGSDGGDTIIGSAGVNDLRAGGGADDVRGGGGNDEIEGGAGNDLLSGDGGNDIIDGGANDDQINGGAGRDTINGGSGADTISGDIFGQGVFADTLTGGSGGDTFVFVDVARPSKGEPFAGIVTQASIIDTITDFDASGTVHDVIDLSELLDNKTNFTGSTVQQAFDLGYIFFFEQNGSTTVKVDLNGGNAHTDAGNVFGVVTLEGVSVADLTVQRNDLFLV